MKLHRNSFKLLAVTGKGVNTDQQGRAYRIHPSDEDPRQDGDQAFQLHAVVSQEGGAGNPGTKVKLQTSIDKVHWVDVIETAKLSANGTVAVSKDTNAASSTLLTWIRAVTVVVGTTKPNHTASVWLTSDASFRCRTE